MSVDTLKIGMGRRLWARANGWLRRRFEPGAVILCYHRVDEPDLDPTGLYVTPRHLAEHLEVIRRRAHPTPLAELAADVVAGRPLHGKVAVTFDDGYRDLLDTVKPLLEAYGVPATVFIPTAHLDGRGEYPWDVLERIFLHPGTLPATLRLRIGTEEHHWEFGEAASYGEVEARAHRGWSIMLPIASDPGPRHGAFRSILASLRRVPPDAQRDALAAIREWAGDASGAAVGRRRYLAPGELPGLVDGGLVEIGAHTVAHPSLPTLDADGQSREMTESRATLERILGRPVHGVAFPYGHHEPETIRVAREAGFAYACRTGSETVTERCTPWSLPRVDAMNRGGEVFEYALRKLGLG